MDISLLFEYYRKNILYSIQTNRSYVRKMIWWLWFGKKLEKRVCVNWYFKKCRHKNPSRTKKKTNNVVSTIEKTTNTAKLLCKFTLDFRDRRPYRWAEMKEFHAICIYYICIYIYNPSEIWYGNIDCIFATLKHIENRGQIYTIRLPRSLIKSGPVIIVTLLGLI